MEQLVAKDDASVYHASWAELAEVVAAVGGCDALIVDAPYSERTHAGHDEAATSKNRTAGPGAFSVLDYGHWSDVDVRSFVGAFAPMVRGWIVTITDHVLAPHWENALGGLGLNVFSPLAFVAPRGPRLAGDGPAQWATWIVVARPRGAEWLKWGSLPGAYVLPRGSGGRPSLIGGKHQWLMDRLVEDYSRPGDLICDPCCGAGTTLTAALRTGRRAIGGDINREHAEMAARAVGGMVQRPLFGGAA